MENKDKAKIIVDVIFQKYSQSCSDLINARADLAKAEMGDKLYRENEEKMGGIFFSSQSPYNIESSRKRVKKATEEKNAREEVYNYAVATFLEMIPEDKS